jgi:hypothetical protein
LMGRFVKTSSDGEKIHRGGFVPESQDSRRLEMRVGLLESNEGQIGGHLPTYRDESGVDE